MLNPCQQKAYEAFLTGKNLFISGGAGTGKSYLLDHIRQNHDIAITATTGIAAVNVGGVTIHSWAMLSDKMGNTKRLAILERSGKAEKIRNAKALAIDEISMLEAKLLDQLDWTLKIIRNNKDEPFGGLQIIVLGDFFQLPPVTVDSRPVYYAFQSGAWDFKTINLLTIQRTNEPEFIDLLKWLRQGKMSPDFKKLMEPCLRPYGEFDSEAINLFPYFVRCNKFNMDRYSGLDGVEKIYQSLQWSPADEPPKTLTDLIKGTRTEEEMRLKIGTKVMLLANLSVEEGLCNGATGKIVGFTSEGDILTKIASNIYDSYVSSNSKTFPVVEFDNGVIAAIGPHQWKAEEKEDLLATYTQIPLMKAWALTIHKSQGLTLDNVHFHAGGIQSPGQYYVAISRLKSLGGLLFEQGAKSKYHHYAIKADPKVRQFYQRTVQS